MRLFAVFVVLVPLLVVGFVVGIVIGAAATQDSVAGPDDVQRRFDEAAALQAADRETALRRFLPLREADGIVEEALAASPPQPEFANYATPEAKTERAALIGAAAKDFAAFCKGREPRECLLAEAEELMATVPESDDEKWEAIGPSKTGMEIAVVLTKAGQFDDALRIGNAIGDGRELRVTLTFIAVQLAKDGQIERAGEVASEWDQSTGVSESLIWVAEKLIDPRYLDIVNDIDVDTAAKVLSQSVEFAELIVGERERGQTLAAVGELYLEIGKVDAAKALIDQIVDPHWRGYLKVFVAHRLAKDGDFAAAERLAALVDEDDVKRGEAFRSIAVELAKAGDPAEARRVAEQIEDQTGRAAALDLVEQTLSEAESGAVDFAQIEAEARGQEDASKRILALGGLAGALIEADKTEAGEAIAAEVMARDGDRWLMATEGDHWVIAGALEGVSRAFRDTGQREAALRYLLHAEAAALAEEDFDDRSRQLLSVAEELIRIGALAEAERVAAAIEDASDRHFATVYLGEALAVAGQFAKAKRIAALIPEIEGAKELHALGLAEVTEALAEAGDFAGAEAIADSIPEQDQQRKAFTTILKTLVADGQLVEAERISRRVEDGAWRAVALAALASRS